MTNLITALKKLGKKMTGEDVTGNDLVQLVDDIAEKYTGGGSDGGSSGGGDGGGDANIVVINCTMGYDDYFQIELPSGYDMEYIYNQVMAGKQVFLTGQVESEPFPYMSFSVTYCELSNSENLTVAVSSITVSGSLAAVFYGTGRTTRMDETVFYIQYKALS